MEIIDFQSAEVSKRISDDVNNSKCYYIIEDLDKQIREACQKGDYYVDYHAILPTKVNIALSQLGYEMTYMTSLENRHAFTRITWKNAEGGKDDGIRNSL